MKAKAYAVKFDTDEKEMGLPHAVKQLATSFLAETMTLKDSRRVTTDAGLIGVLNEMNEKWRAVAILIPALVPGGYKLLIQDNLPEVYAGWQEYLAKQNVKQYSRRVQP